MSEYEIFTFDKGIVRKRGALLLGPDEAYTVSGFSYDTDGVLECRTPVESEMDAVTTSPYALTTPVCHGLHRYDNDLYVGAKALCYGDQSYFNHINHRTTDDTSYTNVDIMKGSNTPRFVDFEKFTFVVDGYGKRAYVDGDEYEWGVPNPDIAPAVSASTTAGNPSGSYYCYYTFVVKFNNDKVYETGPSPAGSVSPSSKKIDWKFPVCSYSGDNLTIYRRLYRTITGPGSVEYLVTEIQDNTTTEYEDNISDADIQLKSVLSTENYSTPPEDMVDIAEHLQRMFGIKDNYLWWSEAYIPFGFKTTSSIAVSRSDIDLVCVVPWADQLYMATTDKWYRLQGSSSSTWSIKKTFTYKGAINRNTVKVTDRGIVSLWHDGLYIFDGAQQRNITEPVLGTDFFRDISDTDVCYAEYDGENYYFYYPSTGSAVDSCVVVDLELYPNVRAFQRDFVPEAHFFYRTSGDHYYTYSDDEYQDGTTETITTEIKSGDRAFKNIGKRKNLRYLYYDVDTGGEDVTVTFYVDGTASSNTLTINTSSRTRKRSGPLPHMEGYRFAIGIACSDSLSLKIYQPWMLEADLVGD